MRSKLTLGIGLFLATSPLFGQVRPAGVERTTPLKVGIGYSNYNSDWNGHVAGPSLWMDWNLSHAPGLLNRIGIEAEGRHLTENLRTFQLRYLTFAGGPVYNFSIQRQRWIRPYAGFLIGMGRFDFAPAVRGYSHDSRTIYGPTGGAEIKLVSRLKLRAGYEYQYWPDLFHHHALNPNGFTIGTVYDFGEMPSHED